MEGDMLMNDLINIDVVEYELEDSKTNVDIEALYKYILVQIKRHRKEKDKSGSFMSRVVGVTVQQYSKYELGVNRMSLITFLKIIQEYGIDVKALIEGIFEEIN